MFEAFERVPAYPLALPVFWGAFAIFLLVLARRLRVFTAVRVDGPQVGTQVPERLWGLVRFAFLQARMFRDPRVGLMHYTLFLGSTLLLIGNINIVTGGLLQAVAEWPFEGQVWTFLVAIQNLAELPWPERMEGSRESTGGRLVLVLTDDSFSASRLLHPEFHKLFSKGLGSPFLAGIPDRDTLVLFSNRKGLKQRIGRRLAKDCRTSPYPITDKPFFVTQDGIAPG